MKYTIPITVTVDFGPGIRLDRSEVMLLQITEDLVAALNHNVVHISYNLAKAEEGTGVQGRPMGKNHARWGWDVRLEFYDDKEHT